MLTNESFPDFINTLDIAEIQKAIDKPNDYITLETFIFNGGGYATIESKDFNSFDSIDDSCLHCDKDDFIKFLQELTPEIFKKIDY